MEWGSFWSSHLPRTPYDISLDDETQNRNDQVNTLCKSCYVIVVPFVSIAEQI
jgi:hexokinase